MNNAYFVTFSAINAQTAANQIQSLNTFNKLKISKKFKWHGLFLGNKKDNTREKQFISFKKKQKILAMIFQNIFGVNFVWFMMYPLFYVINMAYETKNKKLDIVLCRALPLAFFLILFKNKFGIKYLIYECHRIDHLNKDLKIGIITKKIYDYIFKIVFKKANGIICLTNPLKQMVKNKYYVKGPVCVIPDGHNFYCDNNVVEKMDDIFKIIYTGMTFREHGLDILIDSLFMLPKDIKLTIVGGTEKEIIEYKKKYKKLIENDKLVIKGRIPHIEVKKYLVKADCGILALADNLNSRIFCSCLKMFEYMAVGLPIIAPDYPAIRDILNENNALLIKNITPETYSEAILYLKENKGKRTNLSLQSKIESKNYTYEKRAKKIEKFIADVIYG